MKLLRSIIVASSFSTANAAEAKFSYGANDIYGPKNWAKVDVPDNVCDGSMQSGIDIPTTTMGIRDAYAFTSGTCTIGDLTFEINDYSVKASYPQDGSCEPPAMKTPDNSNIWTGLQFHIHSSSDHSMDGQKYGAEFHLVHTASDDSGRLAVLGVFIDSGAEKNTELFDGILSGFELVAANTMIDCDYPAWSFPVFDGPPLDNIFNPYGLIPAGYSVYTYDGSLTTPPCSEIVDWNVVDTPLRVSASEFNRLIGLILNYMEEGTCKRMATVASRAGSTGRPAMDLNGRVITLHCQESKGGCPVCDSCKTEKGGAGRYLSTGKSKKGQCEDDCVPLADVPDMLDSGWQCGVC